MYVRKYVNRPVKKGRAVKVEAVMSTRRGGQRARVEKWRL